MTAVDAAFEAELLDVAVEAARAAGAELLARWRTPLEVETKSTPTDPVTEADVQAERAIRDVLARRRPHDAILGEEGGETAGAPAVTASGTASGTASNAASRTTSPSPPDENDNDSDSHYRFENGANAALRWVVDPLDGTVNFMYGLPTFAVSVAVEDADGGIAAAVLDPVYDELFTATRSRVPTGNGEPIAASGCDVLERALVATGFGYAAEVRAAQAQVAARVIPAARDIRRAGSAALDMCGCAAGRYDAYYERGVKAWDIAAGTLICERAGLAVRTLEPSGILPAGVAVAAPALIEELLALVA